MIRRLYNYILHRKPHAEGVQRSLTTPDNPSQDSRPGMFGFLPLSELDKERRRQIERVCPLDYLSVDTVRRCLQECQLGAYAEQQRIWEQMEQYDPMLMTCITKRDDALSKYDWSVTVKPDLDDRDSLLAEAQQRLPNLKVEDVSAWQPRPHYNVIIADRESEFVDFMIADVERRRQAEEEFFAAIAGEEP